MTSKKNTTSQEVNVNKVKKVNQNVNKIEDMKNSNVNPAVDQRIVDLGEVIKTKLSSVSKTKRVNLKQSKLTAQFILDNWDDLDKLIKIVNDEEEKKLRYKVWCIADSRRAQLENKKKEEQEKASKEKASKKNITSSTPKKSVKKSDDEPRWQKGDHHPTQPWVYKEIRPGKMDWRSDGSGRKELPNSNAAAIFLEENRYDYFKYVEGLDLEENIRRGFKISMRYVADVKKFASDKALNDYKDKNESNVLKLINVNLQTLLVVPVKELKEKKVAVTKDKKDKAVAKKTTTATKKSQPEKEEEKEREWTMDDYRERQAIAKGLNENQKKIRKLINKGYKIELVVGSAACWFKKEGEANVSGNIDSVEAFFKKLHMDDIPDELFLN